MKILLTIIFLLSIPYHAQSSDYLCDIYDNGNVTSSKDLKKGIWFTAKEVQLIKFYLTKEYYGADEDLSSMNSIRTYFGPGSADDLSVITILSQDGLTKLTVVKSYPGDNPNGYIFDEAEKLIGKNSDDSISFNGKYCDF